MDKLSGAEVKLSKKIACVLRHKPESAGLKMDKHGWVSVSELIKALSTDMETLEKIVAFNDKKRFIFSEDKLRIRACQGHSIKVDVELKEAVPPKYLYHGTLLKNRKSIEKGRPAPHEQAVRPLVCRYRYGVAGCQKTQVSRGLCDIPYRYSSYD